MLRKILIVMFLMIFIPVYPVSAEDIKPSIEDARSGSKEFLQRLDDSPVLKDPLAYREKYLLLLSLVGDGFSDGSLKDDNWNRMKSVEGVEQLFLAIVNYRIAYNRIPDELKYEIPQPLQDSFGLFWTDNSPKEYPEVYANLRTNFDIYKNVELKKYELVGNKKSEKEINSIWFLTKLAGKSAWVIKPNVYNNSEKLLDDNFGNYEKVIIEYVDLEEFIVNLKKENGQIVKWKPVSGNSNIVIFDEYVCKFFFLKDPKELYPGWSEKAWAAIRNEKVLIGFNHDQTTLAWGHPYRKNKDVTRWGTWEQWVYGDGDYVYFENGSVVTISTRN